MARFHKQSLDPFPRKVLPTDRGDLVFGGELPLGCDPVTAESWSLSEDHLMFSHVRAALAWLLEARGPFRSVLLCAYTCPELVFFFRNQGLKVGLFDVGESDIASMASTLPSPCMVVLPALLGGEPDPDPVRVSDQMSGSGMVVVDAAQTAFGHLWCRLPRGGAVVSGPRKMTGIGDGAILRLDGIHANERAVVDALPVAYESLAAKLAARAMMAERSVANEADMLELFCRAESGWPETPHTMSGHSRDLFSRLDPDAHAESRRNNWRRLAAAIDGRVEVVAMPNGVPFNLSIMVEPDQRVGLIAQLRGRGVFATPLWSNSEHDPNLHPHAARLTARLIGLPIDQRYTTDNIGELAERVLECLPC